MSMADQSPSPARKSQADPDPSDEGLALHTLLPSAHGSRTQVPEPRKRKNTWPASSPPSRNHSSIQKRTMSSKFPLACQQPNTPETQKRSPPGAQTQMKWRG